MSSSDRTLGMSTSDDFDFEIGDILQVKPFPSEDEPMYCRLTELYVSGFLLIGQYEPVPPSEDAPQGLTLEEIADDVVKVHDELPHAG